MGNDVQEYKSVHKGSKVDIAVQIASRFNLTPEVTTDPNKPLVYLEEAPSGASSLYKGFKLYKKVVNVSRDETTGALTTGDGLSPLVDKDNNEVVLISEIEGGDVNNITKALREEYDSTKHITLVGAANTLSEYAAKHIVGITPTVKSYEITGGDLKFVYRGQFKLGEVTKYLYTVKRSVLPFYFTEEGDPTKITSLGSCIKFTFETESIIDKVNEASIEVGSKVYIRDAYNDLIVNAFDDTSHPNYFAWVNGTDFVFTITDTPEATTHKAYSKLLSWQEMASTPVTSTEKTHTQGVQLNKGTVENMEDETKLEPIKDGLDETTAKEVDSLARTSEVGFLDDLNTTTKESIVAAVNELEERTQVFTTAYDPLHFAKEGDVWMTTD